MATRIGVALAALVAALVIAACGSSSDSGSDDSGTPPAAIDGRRPDRRRVGQALGRADDLELAALHRQADDPRLRGRDRASSVKYIEDVNDNAEFFGKVQPQLDQGESGGRSIFVVTDWMANKMHELGYLQNFDKTAMPNNVENIVAEPRPPAVRPQPRLLDAVADGHDRAWWCARTWRPT